MTACLGSPVHCQGIQLVAPDEELVTSGGEQPALIPKIALLLCYTIFIAAMCACEALC